MELLLRRNYLILTCSHDSDEWVSVKMPSDDIENIKWLGFCHMSAVADRKPCYILCNGWRMSSMDSWVYLNKGEFVAGLMNEQGVTAIIDKGKPRMCVI